MLETFSRAYFALPGLAGRTSPAAGDVPGKGSSYAGRDIWLTVGEITLAPGAVGARHRHPGPTFVYVLEGAVEIELEGAPAKIYHLGESFYEEPYQLHSATKNVSHTERARILAYHLSRKGEPLTQPEK